MENQQPIWLVAEGSIKGFEDDYDDYVEYREYDENGRRNSAPLPIFSPPALPQELEGTISGLCYLIGFLILVVIFAAGAAVYYSQHPAENAACAVSNANAAAQLGAAKAQSDSQTEYMKRDSALRLEVISRCVARGFLPVLTGGNVDCKPVPK